MAKLFLHSIFLPGSYSRVPQDDDSISSREKAINDELAWNRNSTQSRGCYGSWWLRVVVWTIAIFLSTAVVAIFSFYSGTKFELRRGTVGFVPDMGRSSVVFEEVAIFSDPPSALSDQAWDSLMPPGRGFVSVKNPEAYGLKPGIATDSGVDRYSVSMFHQLHCLGMIRKMFFELMSDMPHQHQQHDSRTDSSSVFNSVQHQMYHTNHCFDYIRQGIMCSGDMTLESAIPENDGIGRDVDGWGIRHYQCKNWAMIWDFMMEHHAENNRTNIA